MRVKFEAHYQGTEGRRMILEAELIQEDRSLYVVGLKPAKIKEDTVLLEEALDEGEYFLTAIFFSYRHP